MGLIPHRAYVVPDYDAIPEARWKVEVHPDNLSLDEARALAAFINDNYARYERCSCPAGTAREEERTDGCV